MSSGFCQSLLYAGITSSCFSLSNKNALCSYSALLPEYFSLSQATKEKKGSAKKLSLKRAEIIQKYLLNNGIAADRMEVKGWGGKKQIHDKFDRMASKNVRVEIEIFPYEK